MRITVKDISWTDKLKPSEEIRYDHVIGGTPLGDFEITWKSWKEYPSYTIEHKAFGYIGDENSLESAKEAAESSFESLVIACIKA